KKYVNASYPIKVGNESIYKWKVFAGKATGSGYFGEKIPDLPIGNPGTIATETFIRIGCFDTQNEAIAVKKYYYTKFFRALLGIIKTTQDAPSRVYKFVPLQDFTINSDIDWSKSIFEIDKQLFEKYELSENEINFINDNVDEMEFERN
ncbi:restriction endonuclease, partial [Staphylococcus pseudintermedius]|nr:restriction endonuclease [Staphylococcus pseudintermedius]